MKEIAVTSSMGSLRINPQTGEVVSYTLGVSERHPDQYLHTIERLDVEEWRKAYPDEKLEEQSSLDILDFGAFFKNGVYEEPCFGWREDTKLLKAESK